MFFWWGGYNSSAVNGCARTVHILIQVLLDAFPSRDPNALVISRINMVIADKKDKLLFRQRPLVVAKAASNYYVGTIESFWKRHPWLYFLTNMLRMKMENMLSSPSWSNWLLQVFH